MAKYTVNYSCGHSGEVSLFGRSADRDRKIEWYEAFGHCPECWADVRRQRREQAASDAERWAADNGLPALRGTERQCAWAETIRRAILVQIADHVADSELPDGPPDQERQLRATVAAEPLNQDAWGVLGDWLRDQDRDREAERCDAVAWLLGRDEARFWIDSRYSPAWELVEKKLDEPERLAREEEERRRREEAERAEAEKVRRLWELKRGQAEECLRLLRAEDDEHFHVCVWKSGAEQRVYIRTTEASFWSNRVAYFHTGNHRKRPGAIELSGVVGKEVAARRGVTPEQAAADVAAFCKELCDRWHHCEFTTEEALS